ncbi:MAG: hypothetical protein HN576_03520 [Bacteriovoracaceae bacterium]|jgi:hypothetical protein|nr:hypothetical protein [Bacteriovoracaceae bacterium]
MYKFFILSIFLFFSISSEAAETFYKIEYTVKKDDTFSIILQKYVKENSVINSKTPMIHKTRSENPHIKQWSKLEEGQKITLFISENFLNLNKVTASIRKEKLLKGRPNGYHSTAFYMASSGSFNQENDTAGIDIDFTQNSLLSLGYTALYYPKEKPYAFLSSVYFSNLNGSSSNLNQEISISPEIGINAYIDYSFSKFSSFGGIDYEKFSTFNTEAILNQATITLVESSIIYLTVGINKLFSIGKYKIFSKYSFSKSISTSTDFSSYTNPPTNAYDGYKAMAYLNYKFAKKWFAHTVFKYHTLSGPDKLTVIRFGLGLGFIIN